MSLAARFCVWMIPAAGGERVAFAVHPEGARPRGARAAGDAGGLPFAALHLEPRAVSGPLPIGYAEAVKAHLEWAFEARASETAVEAAQGCGLWDRWLRGRGRAGRRGKRIAPHAALVEARRFAERHFPWAWVEPAAAPPASSRMPQAAPAAQVMSAEPASPPLEPSPLLASPSEILEHAERILTGRRLFSHELAAALGGRGVSFHGNLDSLLDRLVHAQKVRRLAGVGLTGFQEGALRWQCQRCLSPNVGLYPCHRCRLEACPQCDDCRPLGVSSACLVLYEKGMDADDGRGPGQGREAGPERREIAVKLPFSLSPFQARVSEELASSREDALVWAACGSGKTEVTLAAICETVRRGGRVLFALPRKDVVDQLGKRLEEALPGVRTLTLRGGAGRAYDEAPLVVATVHQAVRFCERFDLVIVDEVDAYPLDREVWLLAALERAKRPGGRTILMTATPPERLLDRLGKGGIRCLTLPGRPHGHPLPVPEIAVAQDLALERLGEGSRWDGIRGWRAPSWLTLLDRLARESLDRGRRVLVFVPAVRLAGALADMLAAAGGYRRWDAGRGGRQHPGRGGPRDGARGAGEDQGTWVKPAERYLLASVHAGDPGRQQKVAAFSDGRVQLLISTTILERGITLPYLDVIVFAADAEGVYDARSLVQMAGRVGRSPQDPSGRVVFLARSVTPAMKDAVAAIRRFNELSRQMG